MKTKIIFIFVALALIVLTGCAKSVSEITANDDYVGKTVSVAGTVEGTLKIGDISGYTLVDANGDKITVASERLPAEGDKVTVKGILRKGPLGLAYYIDANQ